ncbi:hypothetical protein Acr_00g0080030 [Actinidia rufa]|uniref:Uncharacterized protein n=1 Tax=Actinidia rufa TaxID=165716 RepID=A0A7J0DWE4_9ERIC|nr:hypothetical protein Acr_00g0080030 [Actinidia rufa]
MGEVEIAPLWETNYFGSSLGEANMMRLRSLRKRITPFVDLPFSIAPPISQAHLSEKRKGKELTEDTSRRTKRKTGETSLVASTELWKPELSACELGKKVIVADSSKDYDTNMALACVILLLNDMASLNEDLQRATILADNMKEPSVELKKAKKKVGSLESELNKAKLKLAAIDQLKANLAILLSKPRMPAMRLLPSRVGDNYSRQVIKIHSEAFMEGWTACLVNLGIPKDNPTWAKAASTLEYPESPDQPHRGSQESGHGGVCGRNHGGGWGRRGATCLSSISHLTAVNARNVTSKCMLHLFTYPGWRPPGPSSAEVVLVSVPWKMAKLASLRPSLTNSSIILPVSDIAKDVVVKPEFDIPR